MTVTFVKPDQAWRIARGDIPTPDVVPVDLLTGNILDPANLPSGRAITFLRPDRVWRVARGDIPVADAVPVDAATGKVVDLTNASGVSVVLVAPADMWRVARADIPRHRQDIDIDTATGLRTALLTGGGLVLPALPFVGVNLSGMEDTGGIHTPAHADGTHNSYSAYYRSKGFNTIRLPFNRARVQATPGGALGGVTVGGVDGLNALDIAVADVTACGMSPMIDMHDYATELGNGTLSQAQFADVWAKLADRYKTNPKVTIDLQNEPIGVSVATMAAASQAAITAIRATGFTGYIFVELGGSGNYANARQFVSSGSGPAFLGLTDPMNKLIAEVHCYLDSDGSGSHSTAVAGIGASILTGVTDYARANGIKLFLGEFGVSTDAGCIVENSNMLDYISANTDVWVGWTAWTTNPYVLLPAEVSASPYSYPPPGGVTTDQPQMATLTAHGFASVYNAAPSGVKVNWTPGWDGGFIPASTAIGTVIGTLQALDPNIAGNTWTFTKVSDPDGVVSVSGSNLLLAATLVNGTTHNVTIRVTDNLGATFDQAIVVQCNSVTTLNPSDKGASLSLSGGNLAVTHSGAATNSTIRAIKSKSAGKFYWEIVPNVNGGGSDHGIGICRVLEPLEPSNVGAFDNRGPLSVIWFGGGNVFMNNTNAQTIAPYSTGRVSVAWDADNRRIWFRVGAGNWNNSGTANPATNTGGIDISAIKGSLFPCHQIYYQNSAATYYFDPAGFVQSVPAGFAPV